MAGLASKASRPKFENMHGTDVAVLVPQEFVWANKVIGSFASSGVVFAALGSSARLSKPKLDARTDSPTTITNNVGLLIVVEFVCQLFPRLTSAPIGRMILGRVRSEYFM